MATSKDFYDLAKSWADAGKGYMESADLGYQCIALIVGLNNELKAGLQPVISDGSGRARAFYLQYAEGWIATPAGWHTVAGDPSDDAKSAEIYNSLPNGAICCWDTTGTYSYYGHISIKAGDWGTDRDTIQQNGASASTPAHYTSMGRICAGGTAGFLGAVVSDDTGWGGSSPSGSTSSSPLPGSSKPQEETKKVNKEELNKKMEELIENFIKEFKDKFNRNVQSNSSDYMFNTYVKLTKIMNLWRVKLSDKAIEEMKQALIKLLEEAVSTAIDNAVKDTTGSSKTDTPQGAPTTKVDGPTDEANMSQEDKVKYITKVCVANCPQANAYGIAGLVGNFVGESNIDPFTFEAKTYWVDGGEDWRNDPTVETLFGSWDSFNGLYKAVGLNETAYRGSDGRHYCGLGLGQWTGPRGEGLAKYGKENGKGWYSLQTQMEYAFKEGSTTEALKACLVNSESTDEGVDNVYQYWERANVPSSLPTRYEGARQYYDLIKQTMESL